MRTSLRTVCAGYGSGFIAAPDRGITAVVDHGLAGLLLTNDGSPNGWAIVVVVCVLAPLVVGFVLRWLDRR
jgi:hypothetical protein